jgi:hypothetical protein
MLTASKIKIDHPNAKAAWITIEGGPNYCHAVLVVRTDLNMDPLSADYDSDEAKSLLGAVQSCLKANPELDRLRIVPLHA